MTRFTCVAEPYGKWMVRDGQNEKPATLGGKLLTEMNKYRAETACEILEKIEASTNALKRE